MQRQRITDEEREQIIELTRAGASRRQVAAKLERSLAGVHAVIEGAGLSPRTSKLSRLEELSAEIDGLREQLWAKSDGGELPSFAAQRATAEKMAAVALELAKVSRGV